MKLEERPMHCLCGCGLYPKLTTSLYRRGHWLRKMRRDQKGVKLRIRRASGAGGPSP